MSLSKVAWTQLRFVHSLPGDKESLCTPCQINNVYLNEIASICVSKFELFIITIKLKHRIFAVIKKLVLMYLKTKP